MVYDLNFMNPATEPAEVPLVFDNKVCSGAFKLAQRVQALLFHSKETSLLPYLGTDAIHFISGNIQSLSTIQNQFVLAADRVKDQIQLNTPSSYPDDERLESLAVEIEVDALSRDKMYLNISIGTVSGNAINSTIPLPLPVPENA
jgi:hypothetical protein